MSAQGPAILTTSPPLRPAPPARAVRRRGSVAGSLFAGGEPMIWLTGGAMLLCIVMVAGLLLLVLWFGGATFWPGSIVRVNTASGPLMGEVTREEWYIPQPATIEALPDEVRQAARRQMAENDGRIYRKLIRTGNFRLTQRHFAWVNDYEILERDLPPWAVVLERVEWGRFYGFPQRFVVVHERYDSPLAPDMALFSRAQPQHGGELRWMIDGSEELVPAGDLAPEARVSALVEAVEGAQAAWALFEKLHDEVRDRFAERRRIEKVEIGRVNQRQETARLAVRKAELDLEDAQLAAGEGSPAATAAEARLAEARARFEEVRDWAQEQFAGYRKQIQAIDQANGRLLLEMETAGEAELPPARVRQRLDEIVRGYPANQLSLGDKLGVYLSRWGEFLFDEPREANSEGGVWPALFGTVVMTLLMSVAVVPFGVLSALYLREYARGGLVVSAVRIAVNNLAGVPSIVFGVFGLGFFCYLVGGFIDGGPAKIDIAPMPPPGWWALLAGMVVTGTGAFLLWLHGMKIARDPLISTTRRALIQRGTVLVWLVCITAAVMLVVKSPYFDGFHRASMPNPTFGKGGLLWASLTLALLTLPVVIVATEEALAAVPNSMREGSLACGASKWQTIQRIILPRALPGIMTGTILAMARGAGEVAPLMLVGAVKLAPELPIDGEFPFLHAQRSFMHLGFHIYDVGFQSQNSEAAKPMVYTTTLLLILMVTTLNLAAIAMRASLKRKFVSSQF